MTTTTAAIKLGFDMVSLLTLWTARWIGLSEQLCNRRIDRPHGTQQSGIVRDARVALARLDVRREVCYEETIGRYMLASSSWLRDPAHHNAIGLLAGRTYFEAPLCVR